MKGESCAESKWRGREQSEAFVPATLSYIDSEDTFIHPNK